MVDRRETGLELREDFREDLSQGQEEETGWLPRTSDSQCGFVVPVTRHTHAPHSACQQQCSGERP